jgi:spore coat protein B
VSFLGGHILKQNLSFLESLINKHVIIYRAGPESKKGILRAVQSDYLVLEAEGELFFYQIKLIGSVHEQTIQKEVEEYTKPIPSEKTFYSLLKSYINYHVKLTRVGDSTYSGLVLDVKKDFVLLETVDDGKVFINLNYIKSANEEVQEDMIFEEEELMESPSGVTFIDDLTVEVNDERPNEKKHTSCNNMKELCNELVYSTVVVRNSEDKNMEGVLVDASDDSISLVKDNEISRVVLQHIQVIKKVKDASEVTAKKVEDREQSPEKGPDTDLNDKPQW